MDINSIKEYVATKPLVMGEAFTCVLNNSKSSALARLRLKTWAEASVPRILERESNSIEGLSLAKKLEALDVEAFIAFAVEEDARVRSTVLSKLLRPFLGPLIIRNLCDDLGLNSDRVMRERASNSSEYYDIMVAILLAGVYLILLDG